VLAALLADLGGDMATLELLAAAFVDDLGATIAAIEDAGRRADDAALRRAGHTLKSTAQTFGALALAQLGRRVELDGAAELVAEIAAEAPRVREALEQGLARLR
jgi:HPt (histidine-containing phosphotransfer) domain-containing protein